MPNIGTMNILTFTPENPAPEMASIRRTVFIDEQGVPEAEEWDEYDQDNSTRYYLIQNEHNIGVGTVRLVESNGALKLTRLAILKPYRRKGFASALIKKALRDSILLGYAHLYLHAQTDAIALYQKFGCKTEGTIFSEAGIDHVLMRCVLNSAECAQQIFGNQVFRLHTSGEYQKHLHMMCELGSRELVISSMNLRDDIFGNQISLDALSQFARSDRRASVRIIIHNNEKISRRTQKVIDLARRLPSKITLKVLLPEQQLENFICLDNRQLIYFNDENQLNGFYCYDAAPESKRLIEDFEHAWAHTSTTDPNFSQLNL